MPSRETAPSGAPSHHRPAGGFCNPWPNAELHGFTDFLRWRFGGRAARRHPSPPRGSLAKGTPVIVSPRAGAGHRSVTWVGHATVLMQLGPINVLTDPMWSDRASPLSFVGPRRLMPPGVPFDALPDIDVVLLSHNHYDHLDAATVRRLAARYPKAIWLCPLGVAERLEAWGVTSIMERDWWQRAEGPGFSAVCTPAQHFSARGLGDRNDTLWCGWAIDAGGTRVFFAGDTALHPEFAAIAANAGPFDLVLLPIGAYDPRWFMRAVHMDPADAVAAYSALTDGQPTHPPCVPIHWGTFRLTDEPVDEPPALFARLWKDAGYPPHLDWTLRHGETR